MNLLEWLIDQFRRDNPLFRREMRPHSRGDELHQTQRMTMNQNNRFWLLKKCGAVVAPWTSRLCSRCGVVDAACVCASDCSGNGIHWV